MQTLFRRVNIIPKLYVILNNGSVSSVAKLATPIEECRSLQGSNACFSTNTFQCDGMPELFKSLTDKQKEQLMEIQLELCLHAENGHRAPLISEVTRDQWMYLLTLKSKQGRRKEYAFMHRKLHYKNKNQRKKIEWQEKNNLHIENIKKTQKEEKHINYALWQTSLYIRINPWIIDKKRNLRLIRGTQFNVQKVIFDCVYDEYMTKSQARSMSKQIATGFGENRKNMQPFEMHVCNANAESIAMKQLQVIVPNILDTRCPLDMHEHCFTKEFPNENFVYLTPYSQNVITKYDPADTYVIPGVVDKGYNGPISLGRAKALGIRTAWFPFNRYLHGVRSKMELPLNLLTNILLDLKNNGSWDTAFRHVPKRKLRGERRVRKLHLNSDSLTIPRLNPFRKDESIN